MVFVESVHVEHVRFTLEGHRSLKTVQSVGTSTDEATLSSQRRGNEALLGSPQRETKEITELNIQLLGKERRLLRKRRSRGAQTSGEPRPTALPIDDQRLTMETETGMQQSLSKGVPSQIPAPATPSRSFFQRVSLATSNALIEVCMWVGSVGHMT